MWGGKECKWGGKMWGGEDVGGEEWCGIGANSFALQVEEDSAINEVNLFIYSGPLTPGGVSLRDIAGATK